MPFNVTYDIVTPESAEYGDYAESGFIAESLSLREALEAVKETRTSLVDGATIELCNSGAGYCLTVTNGMEFQTGANETRTLHMSCTRSTARRIARLVSRHFYDASW